MKPGISEYDDVVRLWLEGRTIKEALVSWNPDGTMDELALVFTDGGTLVVCPRLEVTNSGIVPMLEFIGSWHTDV